MIGSIPRQLETNAAIASFLLAVETFGLGLDYDQRLPGLIGAITKDAADAAARRLLDPGARGRRRGGSVEPCRTARVIKAVFFDVDFTLIFPGPTFQAEGYGGRAPRTASRSIRRSSTPPPRPRRSSSTRSKNRSTSTTSSFTTPRRSSSTWAAAARTSSRSPREIYDQWSVNHHFELYDDVAPVMAELKKRGLMVGLISNSHRSLDAFREHFSLADFVSVSVSGAEHGYMKPHRSIFDRALERAGVKADEALMVGDSFRHDIEGALSAGWRAVLLKRSAKCRTRCRRICR